MSQADAATKWRVNEIADRYLKPSQKARINHRFASLNVHKNWLLLWTGENYDRVQKYARSRNKQTLSIALGPLIDPNHPEFAVSTSSKKSKRNFMHGASALFAQHISNHSTEVALLCPPPPVMFNPNGRTYYQDIEEPIITKFGFNRNLRIFAVHPSVKEASGFCYEIWPTDRTYEWHQRFPGAKEKEKKEKEEKEKKEKEEKEKEEKEKEEKEKKEKEEKEKEEKEMEEKKNGVTATTTTPALG
ncbi:hypothetical protein GGTG_02306 [Gaeumannomyces tritici R3-111a-1]|uniref:Uncharacterized protein n=1 Tax=Gaeumannomyces tritici (strain R3-111a-1) TaxID=644352 RepID=J3NM01_GAET3|nr:hypothetical protein GGTG_02306 [Gaeumannomyces tritici R3-111a-1]EJT82332.1 hypothetical protein GGTG_02306 [Gaeumannomyces tritici R3-111a-1]